MHALVRMVFSRLHVLDPDAEEAKLRAGDEIASESEIRMTVSPHQPPPEEVDTGLQDAHLENEPARLEPEEEAAQAPTMTTYRIDRAQCMFVE